MSWKDGFTGPKIKKWLFKQSLPLGFLVAIIVSMLWPEPGEHVAHYKVNGWKLATTINMSIIFFIFGVTLDTSELKDALKAWKAISYGMVSILFLTPLWGYLALAIPFKPHEFALGLAVMACVPTSLSSGVTLVIQGYGNGALGLLFTVASNIIGIVTAPLMIRAVFGSSVKTGIDAVDLLIKLGVSILMPLVVGKALREGVAPVRNNICKYKTILYLVNNLQITLIVWQKLSAAREVLVEQEVGDVFLAAFAAIGLHFIFLFQNTLVTWLLRYPEMERKAIIIMASQKNMPTAAIIIGYFNPDTAGEPGLITIPCIVFYIMQLFIDSFIANTWASKYERIHQLEESYKDQLKAIEAEHANEEHATEGGTIGTGLAAKTAAKLSAAGDDSADSGSPMGGGLKIGAAVPDSPTTLSAAAPPPAEAPAASIASAMQAAARMGAAFKSRAAARIQRASDDEDSAGLLQNVELGPREANPFSQPAAEDEDLR